MRFASKKDVPIHVLERTVMSVVTAQKAHASATLVIVETLARSQSRASKAQMANPVRIAASRQESVVRAAVPAQKDLKASIAKPQSCAPPALMVPFAKTVETQKVYGAIAGATVRQGILESYVAMLTSALKVQADETVSLVALSKDQLGTAVVLAPTAMKESIVR